ncbi:glutamate-cysteine ligase family protein [Streptomyces diastatochromogenes]|nr:glutamate-cysteine ligase family protein [Streptomyces diastatochromogenes]
MEILTMGVEEEFVLVDRVTRAPVNRAPEVIRRAGRELGEQVQAEFFNAQVEICTRATASRGDLRDELARLRATVGAAARDVGCMPIACGTPVLPPEEPLTVTDTERYRLMARHFASLVTRADGAARDDGLVCGCHVHVGTLDRERALALAQHMRPWLPVLQALAGNSPYAGRRDTGYQSWRAVEHARWPTVGPTPVLDEPQYLAHVARLVRDGRCSTTAWCTGTPGPRSTCRPWRSGSPTPTPTSTRWCCSRSWSAGSRPPCCPASTPRCRRPVSPSRACSAPTGSPRPRASRAWAWIRWTAWSGRP